MKLVFFFSLSVIFTTFITNLCIYNWKRFVNIAQALDNPVFLLAFCSRAWSLKSLLSHYLLACFRFVFFWDGKRQRKKQVSLTFGQSACLTFWRVKSKGSGFMKTYFRLTFKLKLDLIWLEALGLNFVNNFKYLYNFQALLKYQWELRVPLFRIYAKMNL